MALLAMGCPQAMPPEPQPGVTDVRMQNIAFVPAAVTISVGETVRWTNFDLVPHTTTSGNPGDVDAGAVWDSGTLQSGQSFSHTFEEAGEFVYFCEIHPGIMRNATVTVIAAE